VQYFVEDALSVMDAYGLIKPVVMGWSIGVDTMFELAAIHPERVSGLFAVAGVPGDPFSTTLGPLHLPRPIARLVAQSMARGMRIGGKALSPIASHLSIGPRAIEALSHTGLIFKVPDPELAAVAFREFLANPVEWYFHIALRSSEHNRVSLRRIRVPAMFVAGRWDLIAGSRHMATAAARVPDGTFVQVNGSHFLQMEQPELVHRLLLDFLMQVEQKAQAQERR
jgi:pimeloyl-ACP methyl ester carboxylesterase